MNARIKPLPIAVLISGGGTTLKNILQRIKEGRLDGWQEEFEAAARFPNVYCKLSGMVTEADWGAWTPRDFAPYVRIALDAFGPERLMFGSDWPVSTLCASYEQVVQALRDALGPISADEKAQIFGGTAERFYGLKTA